MALGFRVKRLGFRGFGHDDLCAMALQTPNLPGQNQFSPKVFTLRALRV